VSVEAGDYLRFVQIDEHQYLEVEREVQSGRYQLAVLERTS
jgi:allophanate hydrolase subunit 1